MTTGAGVQQIGRGHFSKAKSCPVLKQRREGKKRSDFEKRSDSGNPSPSTPTLPMSYAFQSSCFFTFSVSLRKIHDDKSRGAFRIHNGYDLAAHAGTAMFIFWLNDSGHIWVQPHPSMPLLSPCWQWLPGYNDAWRKSEVVHAASNNKNTYHPGRCETEKNLFSCNDFKQKVC